MADNAVDTRHLDGVTSFHIILERFHGNQVSAVIIPGHAIIRVDISGRFARRRFGYSVIWHNQDLNQDLICRHILAYFFTGPQSSDGKTETICSKDTK